MKIRRRGDLIFGEDHEEEAAQFDCLDRLHYPESPSVADVEHPNGKPGWVWGPAAQRHVQVIGAMDYWLGGGDLRPGWSKQNRK